METTTKRETLQRQYAFQVKQNLESTRKKEPVSSYYGFLCDQGMCFERGIRVGKIEWSTGIKRIRLAGFFALGRS
jgi:hypothetical protein